MKKRAQFFLKTAVVFVMLLGIANLASAQQTSITGTVTSDMEGSMPGVTIVVKGTQNGTVTDIDGYYTISANPVTDVLVFSFIGMKTKEVALEGKTSMDVTLESDVIGLEEVVAVGYGTQKKASLTSAVNSVKADEMQNVSVANASSALVGKMPGVFTVQTSGEVGNDQTKIKIRGVSTTGNSNPLIIIDGVPRNSLNELDMSTVESYTILKDAAAVAPYGMGGANGVILITTKSGTKGKASVQYNGSVGFQNPTVLTEYANSYQYVSAIDRAESNGGILPENRTYSQEELEIYRKVTNGDTSYDPNLYANVDPYDYVLTGNAPITKHNLSISGGNDKITYFSGINYMYQEANWPSSNLNRFGLNTKLNYTPNKKTNIGVSINGWNEITNAPSQGGSGIFQASQQYLPMYPVYYNDPSTNEQLLAADTWLTILPDKISLGNRRSDQSKIMTQIYLEQELFAGFKVKGAFSYDWTVAHNKNWSEPKSVYYQINTNNTPYTFDEIGNNDKWGLSESFGQLKEMTSQIMLNYSKKIGEHEITALGVMEARKTKYNNLGASRSGYEIPIDEINMGSSDPELQSNSGNSSEASQVGYVYRLTYGFKGKYLFEAAGRYDGHYYFAPGKKYGFFPSLAIGWRLSEESFMSGAENLDNLKIRSSFGQSGGLAGSPAQYLNSMVLYGNSYPFGNSATQGVYASAEANPNITWEKATKFDVGLDFSLWEGLLAAEIDYFFEKRDNMLVNPGAAVPVEYGIGLAQVNAGKMQNQGFEMMLNTGKTFNNGLRLDLDVNFSFARNKLIETFENEATLSDPNRSRTNRPIGTIFGLVAERYFTAEDDKNSDGVINADDGFPEQKIGATPKPGNLKFTDVDGDGEITAADETEIGFSPFPEIIYSISPKASWKGFDLSFMLQGTGNSDIPINGPYMDPIGLGKNIPTAVLDFWTPENTSARWPRQEAAGTSSNDNSAPGSYNSWFVLSSSYLRLKNLELGYNLPKDWLNSVNISNLRIYGSAYNLVTWSEAKELLDPEVDQSAEGNSASRGWYNPQQKVISFGINVTF